MKGCVVFASYIPTKDKIYIGKEFLDKFIESFTKYDIYVGINDSCDEWIKTLEDYSKILNIKYEITPKELLIDSDVSAFQSALRLLKKTNKKYDVYWFGHTKGVTSGSHNFRKEVFDVFWNQKDKIEIKMFKENISIYTPYIGTTAKNYLNTTLPLIIYGKPNKDNLASYYTFWVHDGEVINYFIDNCNLNFLTEKITSFERLIKDEYGEKLDRYFFERDFPMIYQKISNEPKLMYNKIVTSDKNMVDYINNNCVKINF
jgi:hypothetical protein